MSNDPLTAIVSQLKDRLDPVIGRPVEAFGAVPATHDETILEDNRQAIQAAIDWSAATGRAVFLGGGVYGIDGTLRLRSNSTLVGIGSHNSQIRQLDTGWTDCLISDDETGAGIGAVTLKGFSIDGGWDLRQAHGEGEKWHFESAALNQRGLDLTSSQDFQACASNNRDGLGDPYNHLSDLLIKNIAGTGLTLRGRGETRTQGLDVRHCANWGIDIGAFDCWLDAATIATCGRGGLIFRKGNHRVSNVKSWFIGMNRAEEYGVGVEIEAPNAAVVGTNITTQDTWGTAFKLAGKANHIVGGAETTGTLFNRWGYGPSQRSQPIYVLELGRAQDLRVDLTVSDRFSGTRGAGLPRLVGLMNASTTNNRVTLTIDESFSRNALPYDTDTPIHRDQGTINAKCFNIVETHTGQLLHGAVDTDTLCDETHGVNLRGAKATGTMRWNTATGQPIWASGPAPTDAWVDAAGQVVALPAAEAS